MCGTLTGSLCPPANYLCHSLLSISTPIISSHLASSLMQVLPSVPLVILVCFFRNAPHKWFSLPCFLSHPLSQCFYHFLLRYILCLKNKQLNKVHKFNPMTPYRWFFSLQSLFKLLVSALFLQESSYIVSISKVTNEILVSITKAPLPSPFD